MLAIQKDSATLDQLLLREATECGLLVEVLRLDKVHPVISGNKWFKLNHYLQTAIQSNKKKILTYGGLWSNHLLATAAACNELGLESIGVVRGEQPKKISATLEEAQAYGMKIEYASRENYLQQKRIQQAKEEDLLIIPEGGYGELGAKGITDISEEVVSRNYSHLLCAVGTGTMLAGFINSMPLSCICLGIPVLKGKQALGEAIKSLLVAKNKRWELKDGFEWGGYAKHPPELIQFMNQFFNETKIPTDIVYTGKLFYAFTQLIKQRYFKEGNKILLIHSGGLQGNRSLDSHELHFKY